MTPATALTRATIFALLALLVAWHAWLAPPAMAPAWAMALAFATPLLPAAVLALLRHRRAGFWGALAALLYFSHGVMAAWVAPDVRLLALAEVLLSALLIVAASWDGMRARFAGRRRTPAV